MTEKLTPERQFWAKVDVRGADECWDWRRSKDPKGYGNTGVRGFGTRAHRVAFILTYGAIPDGLCVCHRCDNPPCCNPAHLFLGTYAENNHDRQRKGRSALGSRAGSSKLSESQVAEIRCRYGRESGPKLAAEFSVSSSTIYSALNGKWWGHVDAVAPVFAHLPTGERNPKSVLSATSVREIRSLRQAGLKYRELAARFGVSLATICQVVTWRTWRQV